jgi:hypothetical protein
MFFLIRVAFWLSIVILLLPTGKTSESTPGPQVGAGEAISAASAAMSDMRQFCVRQPEACEIGSQAAVAFGQKAQAGAKMVYDFLTEKVGSDGTPANASASVDKGPEVTASTTGGKPSQNTLSSSDRVPAWRGQQPARPELLARRPS